MTKAPTTTATPMALRMVSSFGSRRTAVVAISPPTRDGQRNGHRVQLPNRAGMRIPGMEESTQNPGFEAFWAEMQPRLRTMLLARGVPHDVADDVVQEAAIKLFRGWEEFDHSRPLWPLAKTIAGNCLKDRYRRVQPVPLAELPDGPAPYDVEEHGIARARLRSVAGAMASLRVGDRNALLAEIGGTNRGNNSSATKMARMRARRRLAEVLDKAASAFAGVPLMWRRFSSWIHFQTGTELQSMATSAGSAAIVVTLVISGAGGSSSARVRDHDAPRRAHVAARELGSRQGHKGDRYKRIERSRVQGDAPVTPAESSKTSTTAAPGKVDETPSGEQHEEMKVGPARAKTDEGKGFKGTAVCTGEDSEAEEDDHDITVTYYDGTQDGSDEPEGCE
ncbi:MAG: RNA polymerase sigma factor [Actinomycetota bacterium]